MILSVLTPIFAIILLGFLISRAPVSSQAAWAELERLTYYIFFPALLLVRLSASNFDWGGRRGYRQSYRLCSIRHHGAYILAEKIR